MKSLHLSRERKRPLRWSMLYPDAQWDMKMIAERLRGFYKSNLINEDESIRVLGYRYM
jgi:hypothetical protein